MPFLSVIKTFKLAVLKLNEEPASLFSHLFHFADHLNVVTSHIENIDISHGQPASKLL